MRINLFPDRDRYGDLVRKHNVIPVCAEILADTETPVSLLKKIHGNGSDMFLFESVEGGERWGRYSFLGVSARTEVRIFKDVVEIRENGDTKTIPHANDPFSVLRELMARYDPAGIPELPRFWGGLVGYLTYEMVSFFEEIPNMLPDNTPLAHFIIPDELVIFDNIRHTLFAVVISFSEDYSDEKEEADRAYDAALARVNALAERIETPMPQDLPKSEEIEYALKETCDHDTYESLVRTTKDHIRAGEIIQAVISQSFVCDSAPDLWALYRAQRFVNPSPYMFFLRLGETALVGSSPETMVRLENKIATLRPIAGTRPRGKNEQEDRALANELLNDEKERAEHLMLVDLGRNDLGRVGETGSVQVTDLMIVERYSHVMHLVSNICCDLKAEHDAWDLFRSTFPAGTLSGAPKIRAMEIIAELEKSPRGAYGGAVGYVSFNGNMDMAITIRTACVENGRLTVRAGAGIVADSDPRSERLETANKAMAIQKALELVGGKPVGGKQAMREELK